MSNPRRRARKRKRLPLFGKTGQALGVAVLLTAFMYLLGKVLDDGSQAQERPDSAETVFEADLDFPVAASHPAELAPEEVEPGSPDVSDSSSSLANDDESPVDEEAQNAVVQESSAEGLTGDLLDSEPEMVSAAPSEPALPAEVIPDPVERSRNDSDDDSSPRPTVEATEAGQPDSTDPSELATAPAEVATTAPSDPKAEPAPKDEPAFPRTIGADDIRRAANALKIDWKEARLTLSAQPIVDPEGVMRPFYDRLAQSIRGDSKSPTRITHFGDSIVVQDHIAGDARKLLQRVAGDGGKGFMQVARPSYNSRSYQHWGWSWSSSGWDVESMRKPRGTGGLLGLGGFSFTARGGGARVVYRPSSGTAQAEAVEVYYLEQPGGGAFDVLANGRPVKRIDTQGTVPVSRVARVSLPRGTDDVGVGAVGGRLMLFGVALEREQGGVIYENLGMVGVQMYSLNAIDPEMFADQLRLRRSDLIIINYGPNESDNRWPQKRVEQVYVDLLTRFRKAVPETPILVMGSPDRGTRRGGRVVSRPNIPGIVEAQRSAAAKTGCAYYDTLKAMGGVNSVARWRKENPRLMSGDYMHPTMAGAERLGTDLYQALMLAFLKEQARQGVGADQMAARKAAVVTEESAAP